MSGTRKMRDAMPPEFIPMLVRRTGRKPSYISRVVRQEIRTSPIWDAVLALAAEWKKERQRKLEEEQAILN
jgi:hypothetical protein